MKVGLLGLEVSSPNKGCSALGYSFFEVWKNISKNINDEFVLFARNDEILDDLAISKDKLSIHIIQNKNPLFYIKLCREIKKCDVVFDFTEGDSFTELYGIKRFVQTSLMKEIVILNKIPLVLGPQTYGPIYSKFAKKWMTHIIDKAYSVIARDELSYEFLNGLVHRKDIKLSNDIAFELPYTRGERTESNKIRIGLNVSGLLWSGGYSGNNQFGLTIDYKKYIRSIVEYLLEDDKYEIHLIPHVILEDVNNPESDNYACSILVKEYKKLIFAPLFKSPIEAKSYISKMDCFIGSRMHATIASFSAGVPTIPVSYSRKFEGLYKSLNYPYVIHALEYSTEEATDRTLYYLNNLDNLKDKIKESRPIINEKSKALYDTINNLLQNVKRTR